jgi:hypothetical protein
LPAFFIGAGATEKGKEAKNAGNMKYGKVGIAKEKIPENSI